MARNAQNSKSPEGRCPHLLQVKLLPLWYCVLQVPPAPQAYLRICSTKNLSTTGTYGTEQMLDHRELVLKPIPIPPPLLAESRITVKQLSLAVTEEALIHLTS